MTSRALFQTLIGEDAIEDADFLAEIETAARNLAAHDTAGRRWSAEHAYKGYTSYASLDDLPVRDPAFGELKRWLDRAVMRFAGDCGFDLGGRRLKLNGLWVNVLEPGGGHSGHIHPHSVVSGTFYVRVPDATGPLRFEDPRLGLMMAAPPRRTDAPEPLRPFVPVQPWPGLALFWESWLRHEVVPHEGPGERISVSFNYRS